MTEFRTNAGLPMPYLFARNIIAEMDKVFEEKVNLDKEIIKLERYRDGDDEAQFWEDLSKSNLLTLLYMRAERFNEAIKQNGLSLERDGHNLNALMNKTVLESKSEIDNRFRETVDRMMSELEVEAQRIVSKVEVAFIYKNFDLSYTDRARNLFEEVVSESEKLLRKMQTMESDSSFERILKIVNLARWKYHTARCYIKLLLPYTLRKNFPEYLGKEIEFLQKSGDLLDDVLKCSIPQLTSSALADKAHLCLHFKWTLKNNLPSSLDVDIRRCCIEATSTWQDSSLLYKCGITLKKIARNPNEMLEAIDMLEKAVNLDPTKDSIYYNIGLAYRLLWLFFEQHPNQDMDSHQTTPDCRKEFRYLSSRHLVDNPIANGRNVSYLEKANAIFLKSCNVSERDKCMYLVDLARTYISLGKHGEAFECFERARLALEGDENMDAKEYYEKQRAAFD